MHKLIIYIVAVCKYYAYLTHQIVMMADEFCIFRKPPMKYLPTIEGYHSQHRL